MKQLDFDDYTQSIEKVMHAEQGVNDGEKMFWESELFFRRNPALLAAHKQAAVELERLGAPIPTKMLTEIARWISKVGYEGFMAVVEAYSGVTWERGKPYAMANNTATWLARWLRMLGFNATVHKSVIDEAWEREHGNK